VVFVLQPHHQDFNIGAVYALAGAFFLAVALMTVGWLGATEPMPRILFYYFLFSTVLVTPFAVIDWKSFGVRASVYLIGIALTLLVGQVFIVFAYRYASAVKVGPFIYTVIVFTALIDWVLWDRAPTLFVVVGMALVIGGGLIAIRKKPDASLIAVDT
jgi:drug/metabolite transporter (DMT)-like permease